LFSAHFHFLRMILILLIVTAACVDNGTGKSNKPSTVDLALTPTSFAILGDLGAD